MKIIAHRGLWLAPGEKNSEIAFQRCIEKGYGIETDVRDYLGELVICHDVPEKGGTFTSFNNFLEAYKQNTDGKAVLAINIKSDGLHHLITEAIDRHRLLSYFVFDMSFPNMYFNYRPGRLRFFTSVNEFIRQPALLEEAAGIWLDGYSDIWYNMEQIEAYAKSGKEVCIVSPELHGRDYHPLWKLIREHKINNLEGISLCTDYPDDANIFFN